MVWETSTGNCLYPLVQRKCVHDSGIVGVAFQKNNRVICSASEKLIYLFDYQTEQVYFKLENREISNDFKFNRVAFMDDWKIVICKPFWKTNRFTTILRPESKINAYFILFLDK